MKSPEDLENTPFIYLLPYLCGLFWLKNSGDWRNLTPKAVKAKKADIRPNISKLDFQILRGLTISSQHSMGSYKVPWRPIQIRFWEKMTPEPKKDPAGQKISLVKNLLKTKKTHYLRTFNFDFQTFFVRWNCLICRTHFWFWSYHFSKPYPDSIGLQGTLYDPLERWETIVKPLKIRKSSLETFGLMSAFLAFMALGVKFLRSRLEQEFKWPHCVCVTTVLMDHISNSPFLCFSCLAHTKLNI